MKQITFIAIAWLVCLPLMAQPTGGKFFIGGHFSLYSTINKSKNGNTTEKGLSDNYFTIMPVGGYFLNNKIAVGVGIGYDTQIEKDPGSTLEKYTNSKFEINPFGRYYLISGTGGIFIEASMGYSFGTSKSYITNVTDTRHDFGFSALLSPGVYYYITPRLALEAKFGWVGFMSDISKTGNDQKNIRNSFGADLSPDSFAFGLTFTL